MIYKNEQEFRNEIYLWAFNELPGGLEITKTENGLIAKITDGSEFTITIKKTNTSPLEELKMTLKEYVQSRELFYSRISNEFPNYSPKYELYHGHAKMCRELLDFIDATPKEQITK
ncbi:MAG: hypothetical protein LKJ86_06970 [Oscillibacter sp.]|nr:hypothetical protein [Oscillibacter sp.]